MKRAIISIALITVMLAAFAIPALAAPADDLIAILNDLKAYFPNNVQLDRLVSQAKTWLSNPTNAGTISARTVTTIRTDVNDALATVGNAKNLSQLTTAQQNAVVADVASALAAAGLTFDADITGSSWEFEVRDASGNVIASVSNDSVIRQTGIDTTTIVIIIIGVTVFFGVAIVLAVATRKEPNTTV